jgi:hypothetical protein
MAAAFNAGRQTTCFLFAASVWTECMGCTAFAPKIRVHYFDGRAPRICQQLQLSLPADRIPRNVAATDFHR